jgi:AcrR family transcriptional regulator
LFSTCGTTILRLEKPVKRGWMDVADLTGRRRHPTAEALLDATERLLIDEGVGGLSTRGIVEEAGQAHGSIRYHFGSLEDLVVAVVDRATETITARQRAMYESDRPFREKWRQAMTWFEADLEAGYPKLVAELTAAAWNIEACRPGLEQAKKAWRDLLSDAVARAAAEYGIEADEPLIRGIAGLIGTSQAGMLFERLAGIDIYHREILDTVDHLITLLEQRSRR